MAKSVIQCKFFFFFFQSRSEEGEAGWVVRTPYHNPPAQKRTWSGWKKKRGLQSFFSYAPLNVTSSCPTLTAKPHYHHSLSSVEKQKNRKEKKSLRIIPPKKRTHLRRCLLAEWRVCVRRGGSVCVCVCGCVSLCCRIAARRLSLRLCLLQSESRAAACLRWRSHWVLKPTSPRTRPLW